jgi:hypothetical protein
MKFIDDAIILSNNSKKDSYEYNNSNKVSKKNKNLRYFLKKKRNIIYKVSPSPVFSRSKFNTTTIESLGTEKIIHWTVELAFIKGD